MRKDARERRQRLIEVAATLLEKEGYDIAVERIAEAAGIGRGTVYRNFADRSALMLAIMRLRLEQAFVAIDDDPNPFDAFVTFLTRIGLLSALHAPAMLSLAEKPSALGEWQALQARAEELFAIPLRRAQAAGRIRGDLTVQDVNHIAQMLQAVAAPAAPEHRDEILARAVRLLVEGIRA